MLDTLMAGELTFPYYTWTLAAQPKLAQSNSIDCSYSGSRIDRTYFTWVNQTNGDNHDSKYEINCANYA